MGECGCDPAGRVSCKSLLSLRSSQGGEPLEPSCLVGHVASAPKEQNLTTLFSDGENGQVCSPSVPSPRGSRGLRGRAGRPSGRGAASWASLRSHARPFTRCLRSLLPFLVFLWMGGGASASPVHYNLSYFKSQGLKNDFVRNILWTFEDIHMLVGSNMPIFGGGRYPAVSLRLR